MTAAYLKGPEVDRPRLPAHFSCAGKARFGSPSLAVEVAARRKDVNLATYRCDFCGGWHIGSVSVAPNYAAQRKIQLVRREQ